MTINVRLEAPDLSLFEVYGVVVAEEIVATVSGHYARHPTRFAIWDLMDAEVHQLDLTALERVAGQSVGVVNRRHDPISILAVPALSAPLFQLFVELSLLAGNRTRFRIAGSMKEARRILSEYDRDDAAVNSVAAIQSVSGGGADGMSATPAAAASSRPIKASIASIAAASKSFSNASS